jgi:hypothetical protein
MSDIPDDLRDLIDGYLDGSLDEADLAGLEARLRADADARRYFVRYAGMDTDLYFESRARRAGERVLRDLGPRTPPAPVRSPAPRRLLVAAALVLVAVGAAWLLLRESGGKPTSPEVAWLVNAQDCRWADDQLPTGGMHAGTVLRVERGLAEVQFRSGARVVLQGPAGLELLSDNSARLLHGKLTARVADPARGFTVLSPHGKVIDHGTEFGVSVGDDGTADVVVFEGKVEAVAGAHNLNLTRDQSARLDAAGVALLPAPEVGRYVRAIAPPPVIVPRSVTLDFRSAVADTLHDAEGHGTGLTHRLPGTGSALAARDANLRLDPEKGQLELTTTDTDINRQVKLQQGEYLGLRLSDLGFTGKEDFAVTAVIPNIPALKFIGQFGLYAGTKSDRNIRGGVIAQKDEGEYKQFFVNNNGGRDTDSHFVGLVKMGDDLRLTLRRTSGKFALTVENQTTGSASTLSIRHPDFLDAERDLYVGLFGANTRSEVRKTLVIKELTATVWTSAPAR